MAVGIRPGLASIPGAGNVESVGVAVAQVVDPVLQAGFAHCLFEILQRRLEGHVIVVVDGDGGLPITGGGSAPSGPGPCVPGIAVRRRVATPFRTSIGSQVLSACVRVKPIFTR